jgi:hypothetical protein
VAHASSLSFLCAVAWLQLKRILYLSRVSAVVLSLLTCLLQLRWETNVKNGVCGVAFDRRDIPMNKFMVTCLESVFHVYDARTQNASKVSSWCGPGCGGNCMLWVE